MSQPAGCDWVSGPRKLVDAAEVFAHLAGERDRAGLCERVGDAAGIVATELGGAVV